MNALYLLLVGGLIMTGGDIVMKFWVKNKIPYFYAIGLLVYFIALNFLAFSYKYRNIAVGSTVITVINVVTLVIFSWLYFKEKLNAWELFGLALAVVGVIILELARAK